MRVLLVTHGNLGESLSVGDFDRDGRDDLAWDGLTIAQTHAADGLYAEAMAGFVGGRPG